MDLREQFNHKIYCIICGEKLYKKPVSEIPYNCKKCNKFYKLYLTDKNKYCVKEV